MHARRRVLERQEQVRAEMELEGAGVEGGELGVLLLRDNIGSWEKVSMMLWASISRRPLTFEFDTLEVGLQDRIRILTNKDTIALANRSLR